MKAHIVHAFADGPGSGNPAAVCVLEKEIPDRAKQEIAARINLPETAFLLEEKGVFGLRWFTSKTEVDLCGHATLAGAHVLFSLGRVPETEDVLFSTRSGILSARKRDGLVEMDFPSEEPREVRAPESLLAAVPAVPSYVGRNRFDYIALYGSERTVREASPDLGQVSKLGSRGLIMTSVSDSGRCDFISRFFAPNAGIDEDPVTGSAHCCLAPFWSRRLGKKELAGRQASRRGGLVHMKLLGNEVRLSGKAVSAGGIEIVPRL